jgi:hypothetical protein
LVQLREKRQPPPDVDDWPAIRGCNTWAKLITSHLPPTASGKALYPVETSERCIGRNNGRRIDIQNKDDLSDSCDRLFPDFLVEFQSMQPLHVN